MAINADVIQRRDVEKKVVVNCKHDKECSGCVTKLDEPSLLDTEVIESAKEFFASKSIKANCAIPDGKDSVFSVVQPTSSASWRTHAKLAAAPAHPFLGGVKFGLYKARSHEVIPIPDCVVHHPAINEAMEVLAGASKKTKVTAYCDPVAVSQKKKGKKGGGRGGGGGGKGGGGSHGNLKGGEGMLRYVQMSVERSTGKVSCSLVWNASEYKHTQPALSRLVKEMKRINPSIWHSIWVHCNDSNGNAIFSKATGKWDKVVGMEYLTEKMLVGGKAAAGSGGASKLYFTPKVFRQGNIDGFEIIAKTVGDIVKSKKGKKVCELYAGVGLIGLSMWNNQAGSKQQFEWLRCSDSNPHNLPCFERARGSIEAKNGDGRGSLKGKISYRVASASEALSAGDCVGADTLIVDPPRSGLDEETLGHLCEGRMYSEVMGDLNTLLYVSCGFKALTNDLDSLLGGKGGWKLEKAVGYVLFPGSNHIETLCVLTRK